MEAHTFTRVGSYVIDLVVLSLFLGLLTFWIPTSKAYQEAYDDESKIMKEYRKGEIDSKEFMDRFFGDNYIKDKENIVVSVISVILSLGYFATFAYYNDGQTLGKKLFKIKIASSNDEKLSHTNLFLRALIVNGVLASILSCVIIMLIIKNEYVYTIGVLQLIQTLIMIVSLIMMAFRKDKRGIHDLVAKTKVIQV